MAINKIILNLISDRKKAILMLSFLLVSFLVFSQQDNGTDSLRILLPDTAVNVQLPPPEEIVSDDDDNYATEKKDTEKEPEYFLKKWLTNGGLDSFQKRKLPDSFVKSMREDEDFWYANKVFKKEKKEDAGPRRKGFDFSFLTVFLWILIIGGFIAFLAIFLSNSNVSLFRKSKTIKSEEDDTETDNIFAINYQKEIDKAINLGNYRLATRLLFLKLLRNLSDKKVIQYKSDFTNLDYLLQLHNTAWYPGFFRLTRNYEYTWYGQFDVDRERFTVIKSDFENFETLLNKS